MPFISSVRTSFQRYIGYCNGFQKLTKCWQSTHAAKAIDQAPETRETFLANGLRIVSEEYSVPTCSVGYYINVGSCSETSNNNGSANFVERLAFKGTQNRNQETLEEDIERMGAQINSSVSRERTSYTANCLSSDLPKILEILTDATTNLSFSDSAVEQQRNAILEELDDIEKYDHKTVVLDYLHATAYQGTPLSLSIQGPTNNIRNFTVEDLASFKKQLYSPSAMVLAAVGGVNHEQIVDLAKQFFNTTVTNDRSLYQPTFIQPYRYTGSELRHRNDDLPYVHVAMAVEGVGYLHEYALPLMVANQIIGSWDRSSVNGALFPNPLMRYMEKHNYCIGYQSFNHVYSDTSLWGIYCLCQKYSDYVGEAFDAIQSEWMRLCTSLTDFEVSRGKNTLLTQMARNVSGHAAVCDEIGQQFLTLGYRVPFDETAKKIMDIRTEDVRKAVNTYVWDACPSFSSYGSTEAVPDYGSVRQKMYKIFH